MTSSSSTGTERAAAAIKRSILRGELLPGEQLRQERLATSLGVSRVPLREALLILANQGLLRHEKNQGFVVAKRSRDELEQLQELLSILEGELIKTIQWPDEDVITYLRQLNDQMAALIDADDWIDIVELNHEFHHVLWQRSRRHLFAVEVERIWPLGDAYVARGYGMRANRQQAVQYHAQIIDALAVRDLKTLERVSAEHRTTTIEGARPTFP